MWWGKWIDCVWEHNADYVNEGMEIISRAPSEFVTKYDKGDWIGQTGLEEYARRWKILRLMLKKYGGRMLIGFNGRRTGRIMCCCQRGNGRFKSSGTLLCIDCYIVTYDYYILQDRRWSRNILWLLDHDNEGSIIHWVVGKYLRFDKS
jgi:hypothetical protein